jgi:hypothetical protein
MARQCPFDPPEALLDIQASDDPVRRVEIWNGATPLLVTGFERARTALSDPRLSSDTAISGFPAANPGYIARRVVAKAFVNMDNPRHDVMRRMVTRDFTAKRAASMRAKIQRLADGLLDDMLAGPKPADLVASFGLPLTSLVICEMLGVPLDKRDLFYEKARIVNGQGTTAEEAGTAQQVMADFLGELLDEKLDAPEDDLMSRIATDYVATGVLTRYEAVGMCNMLLLGGFETTSNMISLGTAALLQHPEVLAEIRSSDDPALVENAVEELLRWLTILHLGRRRVALEDFEIDGHQVKAGDGVIISHDAADRDPAAFPDPHRLDIHRRARHHLAFGYGPHQCLGQSLARVELSVVYGTLYRRIPTLALAVPFEEIEFKEDALIYGVYELPVTW